MPLPPTGRYQATAWTSVLPTWKLTCVLVVTNAPSAAPVTAQKANAPVCSPFASVHVATGAVQA